METVNNAARIKTVSQAVADIKNVLEGSMTLRGISVRGEISGLYRSRTQYGTEYLSFTMKEGRDQIRCVMFEGVEDIDFEIDNGTVVICEGVVTAYSAQSQYQLKCYAMRPDGEGAEAAALEALINRLREEGLFEQKRALPKYPQKIAVVTSPTGAAVHDIMETISGRYPVVELCIVPALVQGENAPQSLIAGLERAQNVGADLIIFGRGGGSKEDLACFNSEALARAVYASRIPTVSAVGHEVDTSVTDLVADVRALTPTDAANKAVPDIRTVLSDIDALKKRADTAVSRKLSESEKELSVLAKDVQLRSPRARIAAWEARLDKLKTAVSTNIHRRLEKDESVLVRTAQSISNLNPLAVLSRGYAVATKDGKAVKNAAELAVGDVIDVKLDKGGVTAEVKKIEG